MSMMKYKILVPKDEVVWKDDGKRLVLFLVDRDDENHIMVYNFYKNYIHEKLFGVLLKLDYTNKDSNCVYDEIKEIIKDALGSGPASDLCSTLLNSLYVADCHNGKVLFKNNITNPDTIIMWEAYCADETPSTARSTRIDKKWLYVGGAIALGILIGLFIALIPSWMSHSYISQEVKGKNISSSTVQKVAPKLKMNAVYDPKTCTIYFSDSKFESIEYYIDYQKKVRNVGDINWRLQSSSISSKDTLFLKDNCMIYLRGEKDNVASEIQVINVSYYDFITELLVTQDPLMRSMLVTTSSSPFGNTTFLVDGIPQQASYYKSAELVEYIKKGYRVTALKTIGSNLNPTNKHYPKLSKITIQK